MKKLFTIITCIILSICSVFVFASCKSEEGADNDSQIKEIYGYYVVYAESLGEEVLSYEDWLKTIKGEKGEKGDKGDKGDNGIDGKTPVIVIGENGNWFIDGVDTLVPATSKQNDSCLTYYLLQDGTLGVAGHDLNIYDMVERNEYDDERWLSESNRGMYPVNYTVKELVIPEKVADKTVTTILPFGFSYFIKLEKITLPDTLTTISDHAFLHCHALSEINLTDNLTNIGYDCFLNSGISSDNVYNGSSYLGIGENPYMFLTNAVPDSNNTVNVHPDCKVLLSYCINNNNITTLYLPRGLNAISDNAFYRYKGLTDIYYNCPLSDWGESLTEAIVNISKKVNKKAFDGISEAERLQNVYYLDGDEYVPVRVFKIYRQLIDIGFFN